jgi:hypothetical protein
MTNRRFSMLKARPAGSAVDQDGRQVGVSRRQRRRDGTGAGGFATAVGFLVRVLRLVVSVVVLIIVAGILLVLFKANLSNSIASTVHGWARSLAGPFDGIFSLHNARDAIAVNWGIAAVVYLIVGELIARLLGRAHR